MAETEVHVQALTDTLATLRSHFHDERDVHVGADLLLYYEEGDIRQCVAPDVFVTRGLGRDERLCVYKLWEVGRPPEFVLEVTSPSTRVEDTGAKRGVYEALGVQEYFLFDPLGEYLKPPLRGMRLVDGTYRPIAPSEAGGLPSATVGLELRVIDGRLRLFDPRASALLPTPEEEAAARQAAERQRAEAEHQRAEAERQRNAEAAARQAAEARAARAEAELAQLRARLESGG